MARRSAGERVIVAVGVRQREVGGGVSDLDRQVSLLCECFADVRGVRRGRGPPVPQPVDPAREAHRVPVGGHHVRAVDADRRRAGKALALCLLVALDLARLDRRRVESELGHDRPQLVERLGPGGAAVPPEQLDLHGPRLLTGTAQARPSARTCRASRPRRRADRYAGFACASVGSRGGGRGRGASGRRRGPTVTEPPPGRPRRAPARAAGRRP